VRTSGCRPSDLPSIAGSKAVGVRPADAVIAVRWGLTQGRPEGRWAPAPPRRGVDSESPSALMNTAAHQSAVRRRERPVRPSTRGMITRPLPLPPAPSRTARPTVPPTARPPAPTPAEQPRVILTPRPGFPLGWCCSAWPGLLLLPPLERGRSGRPVALGCSAAAAAADRPCCGCQFSPDALLVCGVRPCLRPLSPTTNGWGGVWWSPLPVLFYFQ